MPNPKLPKSLADITGAALKNPQRHRGLKRHKPRPLGMPFSWMNPSEKKCWVETAGEMPWLDQADRKLLAHFCRIWIKFVDDQLPVGGFASVRACITLMGGTPTTRGKVVGSSDEAEDDPASEFLN